MLITAGPTREFFDTVRFLSNPSSGKMGYAIAAAARRRGHDVTLITGPVAIRPAGGLNVIHVVSAAEMASAAKIVFRDADAAVFTAAVCDYRPEQRLARKLKKQAKPRTVRLVPTEDIAATLGRRKGRRVTIGFAMEDHDAEKRAAAKLAEKRCDAIVLNGPENIGGNRATVRVLTAPGGWTGPWEGTKAQIGRRLVRLVEDLVAAKSR
jgi:phosphopantothenoylcysteine decarboxylase/phosphopantothenate--cysteine ligase